MTADLLYLRDNLIKQLRSDEGERLSVYQDSLGFWTIGVGRLVDGRKGGGITAEESAYLLNNDIERTRRGLVDALPWFESLDEARQGALINLAFQNGVSGVLLFKNMLAALKEGRWEDAKHHALDSRWAKQTPERAQRVATQLATGVWA